MEEQQGTAENKVTPDVQVSHDLPVDAKYTFEFRGQAGEYFRIWIVNLLLTVITLGIYSAWAKVRDQRYINGSTVLAGSSFEYTANPVRILIGRIIALVCFGVYNAIGTFYPTFAFLALAIIMCLIPAAIVLSMQFRHRNTVWRGIRFSFANCFNQAYLIFSPVLVIAVILALVPFVVDMSSLMGSEEQTYSEQQIACLEQQTDLEGMQDCIGEDTQITATPSEIPPHLQWLVAAFGFIYFIGFAAFPWWQTKYYQFLAKNSRYGQSLFDLNIGSGPFYKMYLVAIGIVIVAALLSAILQPLIFFIIFPAMLLANAYIVTRRTNILYTELSVDGVHFESTLSTRKMLWLYLSNSIAILLSLGLLIPWARIRTLSYRASETRVYSVELDNFVARTSDDKSALGEELGEVFGLEIGI